MTLYPFLNIVNKRV